MHLTQITRVQVCGCWDQVQDDQVMVQEEEDGSTGTRVVDYSETDEFGEFFLCRTSGSRNGIPF